MSPATVSPRLSQYVTNILRAEVSPSTQEISTQVACSAEHNSRLQVVDNKDHGSKDRPQCDVDQSNLRQQQHSGLNSTNSSG